MENFLFEISVALVGTLFAISALGVKYIMNNNDFKKFVSDNELLIELFKTILKRFVDKYPQYDPRNNEEIIKAYLRKEVRLYFKYNLTERQLDQLFDAAKKAYKNR